ncbi:hypothetical protein [Streptomyces lavendulae]|uniref:hypothetical protein n=1 Tax=Streptomyces lavendulae TaxID=1914 RepID=UPI0033ED86BB
MERSHRRRQPLGAAAALAALLTACGSPAPAESGKPAAAVADAGNRTTYPAQAENCGRTVKVDRAPERIVSFFASHTELLLELGLKDRVAGQTWTNQSPPSPPTPMRTSLSGSSRPGKSPERPCSPPGPTSSWPTASTGSTGGSSPPSTSWPG